MGPAAAVLPLLAVPGVGEVVAIGVAVTAVAVGIGYAIDHRKELGELAQRTATALLPSLSKLTETVEANGTAATAETIRRPPPPPNNTNCSPGRAKGCNDLRNWARERGRPRPAPKAAKE